MGCMTKAVTPSRDPTSDRGSISCLVAATRRRVFSVNGDCVVTQFQEVAHQVLGVKKTKVLILLLKKQKSRSSRVGDGDLVRRPSEAPPPQSEVSPVSSLPPSDPSLFLQLVSVISQNWL